MFGLRNCQWGNDNRYIRVAFAGSSVLTLVAQQPEMTRFIDAALLAAVSADARSRQRLQANFNFHPGGRFSPHRLLNAIEPGSWLPPHRHLDPAKDESIVVVAGALGLSSSTMRVWW